MHVSTKHGLNLLYRKTLIRVKAKVVTDELRCRPDVLYSIVSQCIFDAHQYQFINTE